MSTRRCFLMGLGSLAGGILSVRADDLCVAFNKDTQAEITSERNSSSFTPRIIADDLPDPPAVSQPVTPATERLVADHHGFDGLDPRAPIGVGIACLSPRHGPGQYHSSLTAG